MAEICVLCGKGYKRSVTASHIESHDITERTYAGRVKKLPEAAWVYYWANEPVQKIFPNPLKARKKAWKSFTTYEQWCRARHPEWW
jgi:hypothetical protein